MVGWGRCHVVDSLDHRSMSATEKTTLHILTGFLGSGKTTLLNRLLGENAFRDTAVVVRSRAVLERTMLAHFAREIACECGKVGRVLEDALEAPAGLA